MTKIFHPFGPGSIGPGGVCIKRGCMRVSALVSKMDVAWKHPFTCVIAGPTGCGKTMWVKQFLKYMSLIMSPVPQEVVWCYGEWQPVYDEMKDVTFVEGLPPS